MSSLSFHRIAGGIVAALDVTLLRVGWVPPAELIGHVEHPRRWVDAVGTDAATLELARAGLWLAAAWLGLAVVAVVAAQLPGTLGRMANGLAGRTVPTVLRRTIATALGASVVLVPIAAGASPAAGHGGAMPAAAPVQTARPAARAAAAASAVPLAPPAGSDYSATNLSGGWPWPTSAPPASGGSAPASGVPAKPVPWPRSATPRPSTPGSSASDVVVGPGDCLWAIAAHRLGPRADARRIAIETWRWYAANAATIGPDPGLIHPGQHLHPPTEKGR